MITEGEKTVFPFERGVVVKKVIKDIKSISTNDLLSLAVKAIQEQKKEIEELKKRIETLEDK